MLSRAGKARGRDARAWASGRGRRRQESTEGADSGREVAGARLSRGRPLWRRQAREASRVARLPGPERGVSEGQPSGPAAEHRDAPQWPGRGGRLGAGSCSVARGNPGWFALNHIPIAPVSRANARTGSPGSPSRSGGREALGRRRGARQTTVVFLTGFHCRVGQGQNTLSSVFHPGLPSCFFSVSSFVSLLGFIFI